MALFTGALLAFSVGLLATSLGLDRNRAFYPVVMIVILSHVRRYGSGILGMVAQERAHSCFRLIRYSAHPVCRGLS